MHLRAFFVVDVALAAALGEGWGVSLRDFGRAWGWGVGVGVLLSLRGGVVGGRKGAEGTGFMSVGRRGGNRWIELLEDEMHAQIALLPIPERK